MMRTVMVAIRSAKKYWMDQARARFKSTEEGKVLVTSSHLCAYGLDEFNDVDILL
jgi:hypothetical protein